jgi:hypothetical protein
MSLKFLVLLSVFFVLFGCVDFSGAAGGLLRSVGLNESKSLSGVGLVSSMFSVEPSVLGLPDDSVKVVNGGGIVIPPIDEHQGGISFQQNFAFLTKFECSVFDEMNLVTAGTFKPDFFDNKKSYFLSYDGVFEEFSGNDADGWLRLCTSSASHAKLVKGSVCPSNLYHGGSWKIQSANGTTGWVYDLSSNQIIEVNGGIISLCINLNSLLGGMLVASHPLTGAIRFDQCPLGYYTTALFPVREGKSIANVLGTDDGYMKYCAKVPNVGIDPWCGDGIQNQGEKGIDCGGPCNPCGLSQQGTSSGGKSFSIQQLSDETFQSQADWRDFLPPFFNVFIRVVECCSGAIDPDEEGNEWCSKDLCDAFREEFFDPNKCNNNGVCEPHLGENAWNCIDCDICGDGVCSMYETTFPFYCPQDCGRCNNDGVCDYWETASNCPGDCRLGCCKTESSCEEASNQNSCSEIFYPLTSCELVTGCDEGNNQLGCCIYEGTCIHTYKDLCPGDFFSEICENNPACESQMICCYQSGFCAPNTQTDCDFIGGEAHPLPCTEDCSLPEEKIGCCVYVGGCKEDATKTECDGLSGGFLYENKHCDEFIECIEGKPCNPNTIEEDCSNPIWGCEPDRWFWRCPNNTCVYSVEPCPNEYKFEYVRYRCIDESVCRYNADGFPVCGEEVDFSFCDQFICENDQYCYDNFPSGCQDDGFLIEWECSPPLGGNNPPVCSQNIIYCDHGCEVGNDYCNSEPDWHECLNPGEYCPMAYCSENKRFCHEFKCEEHGDGYNYCKPLPIKNCSMGWPLHNCELEGPERCKCVLPPDPN